VIASWIEARLLARRLSQLWEKWRGTSGQIYFEHRVDQYRRIWAAVAEEVGASFSQLDDDLWELRIGDQRTRILNYQLEFDNPVILAMAGRKPLMHQLIGDAGIPVPEHQEFSLDELPLAQAFLEEHPAGCVIKPARGYGGKGVTTHIRSPSQLTPAAILAATYSPKLLIEKQILGECYRLLVVDGEIVHAVRRPGIWLTGDGTSTVESLMMGAGGGQFGDPSMAWQDDPDIMFSLQAQGLAPQSVPSDGQRVLARSSHEDLAGRREVRTVYSEEVTESVGDSVRTQAIAAAKILGSSFLGVDVITPDISIGLFESGGVINEVNTTPALHHHYDSASQQYPEPAVQALRRLIVRRSTP
jgi:cyanophycin synthetase